MPSPSGLKSAKRCRRCRDLREHLKRSRTDASSKRCCAPRMSSPKRKSRRCPRRTRSAIFAAERRFDPSGMASLARSTRTCLDTLGALSSPAKSSRAGAEVASSPRPLRNDGPKRRGTIRVLSPTSWSRSASWSHRTIDSSKALRARACPSLEARSTTSFAEPVRSWGASTSPSSTPFAKTFSFT